jgi:hypothetical protein
MDPKISHLLYHLTAAKRLAEKDSRHQMVAYLLELAIVDVEEECDHQSSTQTGRSDDAV